MALTATGIIELFEKRAGQQYGQEAVSQLEHALQCAQLAQEAGETDATIVAALLHDIGHLISVEQADQADDTQTHDDLHQYIALPFLRGLLPDAVLEPIRLHVDAKRYLCATEAGYWGTLSLASHCRAALSNTKSLPRSLPNRLRKKRCACVGTTIWLKLLTK
jgi:predicted HD phosphohydrolase